jgi:hypothetical protein
VEGTNRTVVGIVAAEEEVAVMGLLRAEDHTEAGVVTLTTRMMGCTVVDEEVEVVVKGEAATELASAQ